MECYSPFVRPVWFVYDSNLYVWGFSSLFQYLCPSWQFLVFLRNYWNNKQDVSLLSPHCTAQSSWSEFRYVGGYQWYWLCLHSVLPIELRRLLGVASQAKVTKRLKCFPLSWNFAFVALWTLEIRVSWYHQQQGGSTGSRELSWSCMHKWNINTYAHTYIQLVLHCTLLNHNKRTAYLAALGYI